MSIMVTGGAGFVGLNLVEQLLARGETVVVYGREALPDAAAAAFAALPGRLTVVQGDVLDRARLAAALAAHAVDRFFPFAAITAGPQREADDTETVLDVNLRGMAVQLRCAREAGVQRIVFPSSNSVYGESINSHGFVREDTTPPVPISIYGITKYAGERMALRLRELWGLDLVCARIGSVFGPWERDTGVRDLCGPHMQLAIAALRGEAAVLPAAILPRSWIYARDLAAGLLLLLDAQKPAHPVYNIASGINWGPVILDWARTLEAAFPGFRWSQSPDPAAATIRFHEPRPRGLESIERIAGELGYQPRFLPEAAYPDYLAWLKRSGAGYFGG